MRYATFGYAQIESILATVLRTYLRSARMKGSLVADARKIYPAGTWDIAWGR